MLFADKRLHKNFRLAPAGAWNGVNFDRKATKAHYNDGKNRRDDAKQCSHISVLSQDR